MNKMILYWSCLKTGPFLILETNRTWFLNILLAQWLTRVLKPKPSSVENKTFFFIYLHIFLV